jgi:hypothetical protein
MDEENHGSVITRMLRFRHRQRPIAHVRKNFSVNRRVEYARLDALRRDAMIVRDAPQPGGS